MAIMMNENYMFLILTLNKASIVIFGLVFIISLKNTLNSFKLPWLGRNLKYYSITCVLASFLFIFLQIYWLKENVYSDLSNLSHLNSLGWSVFEVLNGLTFLFFSTTIMGALELKRLNKLPSNLDED